MMKGKSSARTFLIRRDGNESCSVMNAGVRCSSHLGGTIAKVHGPRITSQVTESKQQLFRGRNLVDHGVGKVSGILL